MIDISKGRYWDRPLSLVDGCTPCSPGCDHCWAAGIAHHYRRGLHYPDGRVDMSVPNFTNESGKFDGRIQINPERLSIPIGKRGAKKATVYAIWNDWAHEGVSDDFRRGMMTVAKAEPQHTFLALTKRPESAARFFAATEINPPENWWSGLTICNQQEADEKIPVFLQVPGKKFLSIEPMLGAVNLTNLPLRKMSPIGLKFVDALRGWESERAYKCGPGRQGGKIDAVILGGETGTGARPLHPDWARSVRDKCAAAGVPFFFKQWGKHLPQLKECIGNEAVSPYSALVMDVKRLLDGRTHDELPWSAPRCGKGREDG
jgi:protein gp37